MRLELKYEFVRDTNILLSGNEVGLGVALGFISTVTAVALAAENVREGSKDPILLALADPDQTEPALIRSILDMPDPPEVSLDPLSSRKWAYLTLKAAYALRGDLEDPLGLVESLYADLGYPPAVAPFVRYMPPPPDAPVGEEALFDRWSIYLATEESALCSNRLRGDGA